eukprot:2866959-Rhodomonas_salina.1
MLRQYRTPRMVLGASQYWHVVWCCALPGTDAAYDHSRSYVIAMMCPVLTQRMVLRACFSMPVPGRA